MYKLATNPSYILLHPTLRTLTISCAQINCEELADLTRSLNRTPLTTLCLDQCDVPISALKAILSLPAALRHFSLLENRRSPFQSRDYLSSDFTMDVAETLKLHSHSLESLSLSFLNSKKANIGGAIGKHFDIKEVARNFAAETHSATYHSSTPFYAH